MLLSHAFAALLYAVGSRELSMSFTLSAHGPSNGKWGEGAAQMHALSLTQKYLLLDEE